MIRQIRERDLQRVSALIQNTLLVSNLADYDLEIIGNLTNSFSPQQLRVLARRRKIFIYEDQGAVFGTIGLEDGRVYNFFVSPDKQGSGVGSKLLDFVENQARIEGRRTITVDSSLTAVSFYRKKGYRRVGEQVNKSFGRTVTMEKRL
ncbi:MAG: GNAT family N-acetyltransferase [Spirochaetaceae bacterium]|nr:MAG: GNAT family N-acetyltransferase [Spirochaetaceae bacterium]